MNLQSDYIARKHLVEEVMALWGRSQLNPLETRRWLEDLPTDKLGCVRDALLDGFEAVRIDGETLMKL